MITHYDLFAGIGGFSLALEEVFTNEPIRHIFCEWEKFPTAVLKNHWPDGEFWGDIAELVTHTSSKRLEGGQREGLQKGGDGCAWDFTIVTGGFPCQPFSAAGRRRGTADDRYQWPNMLEVIRNVKPDWVIAENVRGLVTWNEGMVLEQVCADLESEGYEVQPFIIPAVAVNAPHRRDRVWIIGHNPDTQRQRPLQRPESQGSRYAEQSSRNWTDETQGLSEPSAKTSFGYKDAQDAQRERVERRSESTGQILGGQGPEVQNTGPSWPDWSRDWQEVAFATCDDAMDDGLSRLVDGVPYSRAKWRKDSLKAYGNGIVPEVAINIMQAIKQS